MSKVNNDPMGERLKSYERVAENVLPSRLPVIIRLDGNSFSRLTKVLKLEKPFDERFNRAMDAAAIAVLEYCSGAQVAYVQSDEITVLLRNDQTHETTPFLANRTQKIASLTASTASVVFNQVLARELGLDVGDGPQAIFDARVFVVPSAEVNNAFLWRQLDAFKNSVGSVAYWGLVKKYGRKSAQKMLHGKSTAQRQELIFQEFGFNFNDLPAHWKRGRCIVRKTYEVPVADLMPAPQFERLVASGELQPGQTTMRSSWVVDRDIPRFNHDKGYIGRFLSDDPAPSREEVEVLAQ